MALKLERRADRLGVWLVYWLVCLFNIIQIIWQGGLFGFNNAMHNGKQQQTTDRQTTDNRRQAGREIQTAGRQAGRTAVKKLKSLGQKFELHTPHPNFKPFSPRELFRGMGGLPKNSVYLKNDYFCNMNILVESLLKVGLLVGFEFYGPDEEYDFNELQLNLLIVRLTFTWH